MLDEDLLAEMKALDPYEPDLYNSDASWCFFCDTPRADGHGENCLWLRFQGRDAGEVPDVVTADLALFGLCLQYGDYVREDGAHTHWHLCVDDSEKLLLEAEVRYGWVNR